jgi:hypothetical protein
MDSWMIKILLVQKLALCMPMLQEVFHFPLAVANAYSAESICQGHEGSTS